jgi:two-component system, NtrC family, response regulator
MARVLIIDDDEGFCYTLSAVVQNAGHEAFCAHTLKKGLERASTEPIDVVYLDVMMPDGNGLDLLPIIKETASRPEVIISTSQGDPEGAELAIKSGAWDYVQKPSSILEMTLPLLRALQYRKEKQARTITIALRREEIIGSSPRLISCLDLLARAANSDANVLIEGETGTGKELLARAIHNNSSRAYKNFVVVDCAALPETLVESLLFGHLRGAYTGADKSQEGLIEQAEGGTLFLDEVGELPLSVQKTFLRTLQERRFRPIGSKKELVADFRLVSATNRVLDEMVKGGQFRNDLLFRLRAFTIDVPPLRVRCEDIKELSIHRTARLCEQYGTETKGFSPDFFETLTAYGWPGNVRELFNTLERAIAAAQRESVLCPYHLPPYIRVRKARTSLAEAVEARQNPTGKDVPDMSFPPIKDFREALIAEGERKYLEDLLSFTRGNINESCRISGLGRARLYGLMKLYNISRLSDSAESNLKPE